MAPGEVGGNVALPLVLHVLPADLARGAQVFAGALRGELDGRRHHHRVLTLFDAPPAQLRPDVELAVGDGWWRGHGLHPGAVLGLRRALRQLTPNVVVAHGGEALQYAVVAARPSVPLVYKKTGMSSPAATRPPLRELYRLLARRAAVTVVVSEETAREARALLGLPASRVVLAPNGRDPQRYQPAPGGPVRVPPRLVFIGRLTATKGPERFLDLLERLQAQGIEAEGLVVGDGPLADRLAARAGTLGVEMLGRRDDVAEVLRGADLLVFPGDPEGEGMPGVLIEAGLAGLPAVASEVSGATTVIDHGVTGLVVPAGDQLALEGAVAELARDPQRRARMGEAARRRCLEHFTLAASAARWSEVLDDVLARRPVRSAGVGLAGPAEPAGQAR